MVGIFKHLLDQSLSRSLFIFRFLIGIADQCISGLLCCYEHLTQCRSFIIGFISAQFRLDIFQFLDSRSMALFKSSKFFCQLCLVFLSCFQLCGICFILHLQAGQLDLFLCKHSFMGFFLIAALLVFFHYKFCFTEFILEVKHLTVQKFQPFYNFISVITAELDSLYKPGFRHYIIPPETAFFCGSLLKIIHK